MNPERVELSLPAVETRNAQVVNLDDYKLRRQALAGSVSVLRTQAAETEVVEREMPIQELEEWLEVLALEKRTNTYFDDVPQEVRRAIARMQRPKAA